LAKLKSAYEACLHSNSAENNRQTLLRLREIMGGWSFDARFGGSHFESYRFDLSIKPDFIYKLKLCLLIDKLIGSMYSLNLFTNYHFSRNLSAEPLHPLPRSD
jgi:hypothetical protein